jgi:UDP-N-acetylglucosamine--N-acetylmuramyl-(pentapeptide) pyrophosphoryl-undecaprenol N-acetylglucosamine transferase
MIIERVIISGGGTGGHIFPAIAIADEIKKRNPLAKVLFVGAKGKMEMEKVPQAGYKIEGLEISGFQRKFTFSNFLLPIKIAKSLLKARRIIKKFKPDLVIGVGGYASGPTLKMAQFIGIPTVIQEQNSFPGKTNRMLAKKTECICTAYEGMEKYFPKTRVVLTGNPVRKELTGKANCERQEAQKMFNLNPDLPTVLVIGGSLGAKTLNRSMLHGVEELNKEGVQLLWQCGKHYFERLQDELIVKDKTNIHLHQFISRMDCAYSAADVIISRAGAISVSELSIVGKPVILVPSPNVSEDHQTKNAMALVEKNAALLVRDTDARDDLVEEALKLIKDNDRCQQLSKAIKKLEKPNAVAEIVDMCEKILDE